MSDIDTASYDLTTESIARRLHLKPATIRQYFREGALEGLQFGRHWRTTEAAFQKFLDAQRPKREEVKA